ncbi:MAG TPA: hypothetical protein VF509_09165 [Sphingobium sp.]
MLHPLGRDILIITEPSQAWQPSVARTLSPRTDEDRSSGSLRPV